MTSHRRLRIGGWAALLVAIAAPIEAVVAGFTTARSGAMDLTAISVVEIMRFTVLLIAVVGLDPLFRSLAPDTARPVRIVGVVAAISLIASDVAQLATGELGAPGDLLSFVGAVLIGIWFIGGGAILMRQGGGLARIGWTAELGGFGNILTAAAVAVNLTGPGGASLSWVGWTRILGLFVIVYLARVWLYVVRGRLPGPGIL